MSGLTRKQIYVDRNLSAILGVTEGELVSYADIQKRLHRYIKENDLKNPERKTPAPAAPPTRMAVEPSVAARTRQCRDCGTEIPFEAIFCDVCGVAQ